MIHCADILFLQGYQFPVLAHRKQTTISVDLAALQRNPQYWEHPNFFNPDRFSDEAAAFTAFLPFGFGPRTCIGQRMAMMILKVTVAMLLQVLSDSCRWLLKR